MIYLIALVLSVMAIMCLHHSMKESTHWESAIGFSLLSFSFTLILACVYFNQ